MKETLRLEETRILVLHGPLVLVILVFLVDFGVFSSKDKIQIKKMFMALNPI